MDLQPSTTQTNPSGRSANAGSGNASSGSTTSLAPVSATVTAAPSQSGLLLTAEQVCARLAVQSRDPKRYAARLASGGLIVKLTGHRGLYWAKSVDDYIASMVAAAKSQRRRAV